MVSIMLLKIYKWAENRQLEVVPSGMGARESPRKSQKKSQREPERESQRELEREPERARENQRVRERARKSSLWLSLKQAFYLNVNVNVTM